MQPEIGVRDKLFNLTEAKELLPLVQIVTKRQFTKLSPIKERMNRMLANDPRRRTVEQEFEFQVSQWRSKVMQLGARVSGLWTVEFDVGDGSLCWRYPELSLNYFRKHGTEFSERVKLRDYIEECDPEWVR
jgi:hypothetical protein